MLGLPLTFLSPFVLAALATLPAIWLLLRVTPPQPRRIDFPPLRILADILPRQENPARTPWWLLVLRLLVAALLILAAAGPLWNPGATGGRGPLLLIIDSGFPAAHDWRERAAVAAERLDGAQRDGRAVALLATGDKPNAIEATAPAAALDRLRAVKPQPWLIDRRIHTENVTRFLATQPEAEIVWISDGVQGVDDGAFAQALADAAGARALTILQAPAPPTLAIAGTENRAGQFVVHVRRAVPNGRDAGTLRAMDLKGLPLADARFAFRPGATESETSIEVPMEIRNAIARIDILGESSAGAVHLSTSGASAAGSGSSQDRRPSRRSLFWRRHITWRGRSGPMARCARRPAAPPRRSGNSSTSRSRSWCSRMWARSIATPIRRSRRSWTRAGLLLRFAGTRLAAGNDDLVPVRLRRGGRSLGGALSWDAPKTSGAVRARKSPSSACRSRPISASVARSGRAGRRPRA
jgi:hypothetical protein